MRAEPKIKPEAHSARRAPTRQRILDAAQRVCAARGLHGVTTREIADVARVNEVTLFRHFGSKEKLIGALFRQSLAAQTEALSDTEPDSDDLHRDLGRYAQRFDAMLFAHEALIRTLIGEARRHPEPARQVICDAVQPMRARLVAYLEAGQQAGSVRRDLAVAPAIDAFTGMLLAGMLRRTGLRVDLGYDHAAYLRSCVELFLRGIEAPAPAARALPLRKATPKAIRKPVRK